MQTVNSQCDLEEINNDFKIFDSLIKIAQANSIPNLKYLALQFEGVKEETNYSGLYKKLDALLKKPMTVFIQGDTYQYVPTSNVTMGLKKLDVIPHKYNAATSINILE